jgi:hypothetical protein
MLHFQTLLLEHVAHPLEESVPLYLPHLVDRPASKKNGALIAFQKADDVFDSRTAQSDDSGDLPPP